jgi:muconolactone delta-isomerase
VTASTELGDPTRPHEGAGQALEQYRAEAPQLALRSAFMSDDEIARAWRVAQAYAQSGMYQGADNEALTATQAFAKILLGHEMGIDPGLAMSSIHIVRGRAQLGGALLGSFIKESPNHDYKILEHDNSHAKVEFAWRSKRNEGEWESDTVEFSVEDARRAQIFKARGMWETWPENMCIWRCLSNGIKFFMPELLKGLPVYSEADSFEERRVDQGDGDGRSPGWKGMSQKQITTAEAMIKRAKKLEHANLSDVGTVQMQLGMKTPNDIDAWLRQANKELDEIEPPDADVVEEHEPERPIDNGGVTTLELGGEQFEFGNTADPYASIIEALNEGPDSLNALALDYLAISEGLETETPGSSVADYWARLGEALHAEAELQSNGSSQ